MSPRVPPQHVAVDAVVDKLADVHEREVTGCLVIDVLRGTVTTIRFQLTERVELTPPQECGTK